MAHSLDQTTLLTVPNIIRPFGNAQARLTFTDNVGVVLFSTDILMLTVHCVDFAIHGKLERSGRMGRKQNGPLNHWAAGYTEFIA